MQSIIIIVTFIDYHAVQPWNRHNPLGLWQHECAEIELGGGQVFNDETTQRGKYPRIGLSYFSSLASINQSKMIHTGLSYNSKIPNCLFQVVQNGLTEMEDKLYR